MEFYRLESRVKGTQTRKKEVFFTLKGLFNHTDMPSFNRALSLEINKNLFALNNMKDERQKRIVLVKVTALRKTKELFEC